MPRQDSAAARIVDVVTHRQCPRLACAGKLAGAASHAPRRQEVVRNLGSARNGIRELASSKLIATNPVSPFGLKGPVAALGCGRFSLGLLAVPDEGIHLRLHGGNPVRILHQGAVDRCGEKWGIELN